MRRLILLPCLVLASCGGSPPAAAPDMASAPAGTTAIFDLSADLTSPDHFYDFPYPSDLRLTADGAPDLRGFPNPRPLALIEGLRGEAMQRKGFPVVPVAWFRFSGPIPAHDSETLVPADPSSPILLLDVDPASPERGRLFPTVAHTAPGDDFLPDNVLSVAPRPGFVLHPGRKYAFVIQRSLNDANGQLLAVPPQLDQLRRMEAPAGAQGAAAVALFAPLWSALPLAKVDPANVAAATVFTPGDVVADTAALTTALVGKYQVTVTDLKRADDDLDNDRFCKLVGKVVYPQFQKGTPPFNTEGLFDFSDGGLPAKQRDEAAPVVITLPKAPMPQAGYPLLVYFHGSGGLSSQAADFGATPAPGGVPTPGKGPAYVHAANGIAVAASALPVNPERLPGAGETAYLNLENLPAFRDTFRQGVIEQRLFIAALSGLTIAPEALGGCTGPSLPGGATAYRFDLGKLVAQGQSMGGMYTNLVSAVEPKVRIAVPTGAGGYWSYFILKTSLLPGVAKEIAFLLNVYNADAPLTFLHPALHLVQTAWEPSDPFVYMPRLARRPLPNHPVRPIYEPVGKGDEYFPTVLYDAIALSYGHQEAGDVVWPTMQQGLALDHLDGILPYPVRANRPSEAGGNYTAAVMQYMGDGIEDPHAIYRQLDSVKYQYGCFVSTFLKTGTAVIPAPAPLGTPCPE